MITEPKFWEELEHELPSQDVLAEFVHHNPLHVFEGQPFRAVIQAAEATFDTNVLPGKERLDQIPLEEYFLEGAPVYSLWESKLGYDFSDDILPPLYRLLGHALDRGVSEWVWKIDENGFWKSLQAWIKNSYVPVIPGLSHERKEWVLRSSAEEVLQALLQELIPDSKYWERYIVGLHRGHLGWSGLLAKTQKMQLVELSALELLMQVAAKGNAKVTFTAEDFEKEAAKRRGAPSTFKDRYERFIAFEEAEILTARDRIFKNRSQASIRTEDHLEAQVLFCIDDRECSIRRHLEATSSQIETFGTPGHFGLEITYHPADGAPPSKRCPPPATPKFKIFGRSKSGSPRALPSFLQLTGLTSNWMASSLLGIWPALRLAISVFRPSIGGLSSSALTYTRERSHLDIWGEEGFSIEDAATRVYGVLQSTGLGKPRAPYVVLMAHGATTSNNPYYAAYHCGACSGRSGAVNAEVFAMLANDERVRERVKSLGIDLGDTVFVGAIHDTTRDDVHFFAHPEGEKWKLFVSRVRDALFENALERCQKMPFASKIKDAKRAKKEVEFRSTAIFEARPELNHATNAFCIVGRRQMTMGTSFDRRAFLQSYDPYMDPEGDGLLQILSAAVPVCSGINLEYYFSTVDPKFWGAGSKLPHNVMGLVAVTAGVEEDLLTGLPTQMTEFHIPVRITFIVEQRPEVLSSVLERNQALKDVFYNEWAHLASVDPESGAWKRYQLGEWKDA